MTESTIFTHWAWQRREDISTNHEWVSELMSNGGVCRAAPVFTRVCL